MSPTSTPAATGPTARPTTRPTTGATAPPAPAGPDAPAEAARSVLAAAAVAVGVVQLLALPAVGGDLRFGSGHYQWAVAGPTLAFGALVLPVRTAFARDGRRLARVGALLLVLTSAVSATAESAVSYLLSTTGTAAALALLAAEVIAVPRSPHNGRPSLTRRPRPRLSVAISGAVHVGPLVVGVGAAAAAAIAVPGWRWDHLLVAAVSTAALLTCAAVSSATRPATSTPVRDTAVRLGGVVVASLRWALPALACIIAALHSREVGWDAATTRALGVLALLVTVAARRLLPRHASPTSRPFGVTTTPTDHLPNAAASAVVMTGVALSVLFAHRALTMEPAGVAVVVVLPLLTAAAARVVAARIPTRLDVQRLAIVVMGAGCVLLSGTAVTADTALDLAPGLVALGASLGVLLPSVHGQRDPHRLSTFLATAATGTALLWTTALSSAGGLMTDTGLRATYEQSFDLALLVCAFLFALWLKPGPGEIPGATPGLR